MSDFESIGTIHYRVLGKEAGLFFVPDSKHFLKYSGKSYAFFIEVPLPENGDNGEALAVPLQNIKSSGIFVDEAVPINISKPDEMRDVLQVALQAAQNETKVALRVESEPRSSVVELVGITFPAR